MYETSKIYPEIIIEQYSKTNVTTTKMSCIAVWTQASELPIRDTTDRQGIATQATATILI
jgi:hypothetical protein